MARGRDGGTQGATSIAIELPPFLKDVLTKTHTSEIRQVYAKRSARGVPGSRSRAISLLGLLPLVEYLSLGNVHRVS